MILLPLMLAAATPRAQAAPAPGGETCAAWSRHVSDQQQAGDTARTQGRAEIAAGGDGTDALIAMMDKKSAYAADRAWLAGFLSGLRYQRRGLSRTPDLDSAHGRITAYCSDHPKASAADAAARLVRGGGRRR